MPVVIVSSPRTGSNALAFYIKEQHNTAKIFSEPEQSFQALESFKNYYNLKSKFNSLKYLNIILKIMSLRIDSYNFVNWDKFTVIRLTRRDLAAQITSFYIAQIRTDFIYISDKENVLNNEIITINVADMENKNYSNLIPIKMDIMDKCIDIIKLYEKHNNDISLKIDYDLVYEDIIYDIKNQNQVLVTPQPENYKEIYQIVVEKLKINI